MRRTAPVRGTGTYVSVLAARKAVALVILVPIGRHLTPYEFGAIALGMALASALAIVMGFGMEMLIFRAAARGEHERLAAGAVVALLAAPALGALLVGVVWTSGGSLNGLSPYDLILIVLASVLGQSLNSLVLPVMRARQRLGAFVTLNFAISAVLATTKLVLIVGMGLGVTGWFIGELAAGLLAYLCALTLLARPSPGEVRRILVEGLPLLPHQGGAWAISQSDRLVLGRVSGAEETGLYAAAGLIPGAVGQAISEVSRASAPAYAKRGPGTDVTDLALSQIRTAFLTATPFSLVGPCLLSLAYPGGLSDARAAIPMLILGQLLYATYLASANALTLAEGQTHRLWRATVTAALLNVTLTFALANAWGLWGAAIATVATYAAMSAGASALLAGSTTRIQWRVLAADRTLIGCTAITLISTLVWPVFG